MKRRLNKAAPKPDDRFVRELKQELLARIEVKEEPSFSFFRNAKRLTFAGISLLLTLSLGISILYPFSSSAEDFIANADEYYDNYEMDGIFYQKILFSADFPNQGELTHYSYQQETWTYNGYVLRLVTPLSDQSLSESSLSYIDEFGNEYLYSNNGAPQLNIEAAPYCLVQVDSNSGEKSVQHIFEASPQALELYESIYLETESPYPFTQFDLIKSYGIYVDDELLIPSKAPDLILYEMSEEDQAIENAYQALEEAESSPQYAKAFFDLLSQGAAYQYHTEKNLDGSTVHVFSLPKGESNTYEEFVFGEDYALLAVRSYQDARLVTQVEYLETKTISQNEFDSIFDPERYGFSLVYFSHPLEMIQTPLAEQGVSGNKACFSFENELLSDEETKPLLLDYAPLFENIEYLGRTELNREEQQGNLNMAYKQFIYKYLSQGLFEEAYESTTDDFKENYSYEDFAQLVAPFQYPYTYEEFYESSTPNPSYKVPQIEITDLYTPERGLGDLAITVNDGAGTELLFAAHFVLEGGEWKLDLLLEGEAALEEITNWGYEW